MANEDKPQANQIQIELTPEVAQGVYANMALIAHGSSEVVLDFIRVLPGLPKAGVQSRIIMAPEHAKRLLYALQDNIMRYEQTFGPIRMPEQQQQGPRTVAPFKMGTGEA
ncbi:MAG: DUF3467 domain-containing protein [Clostridium sp.]|nr:DUF3467 domain-containing protein [Clostridium sp.]